MQNEKTTSTPKKKRGRPKRSADEKQLRKWECRLEQFTELGIRSEYEKFCDKFGDFNKLQYFYARGKARGLSDETAYKCAGGKAKTKPGMAQAITLLNNKWHLQEAIDYLKERGQAENLDKLTVVGMYLDLYKKTEDDSVKRAVLSDLSKIVGAFAPTKVDVTTTVSISNRLQEARERQLKYLNDRNTVDVEVEFK